MPARRLRDLAGFRVNEVYEFTCQAGHGNVAIMFAKGYTLHRGETPWSSLSDNQAWQYRHKSG